MREMKNSGIEWIGDIPSDWKTIRMKSCFIQRDGGAWGDEATGEDGDTICLRIADFDYGRYVFKDTVPENLTKRNYTSEVIEKLRLNKDDILIEKSGGGEKTPVGRTVIFDKDYFALFANFMDRLRCADFIYPKYMQYTFVTFYKNQYTRNYIKQTTGIQNLDLTSMLSNETVPFPHYIEQKRIADFLDEKCAEIDTVIEKTKATIEEYKKLKQSVITQAVTKGIRPNRTMKDSGIEWICEIPADWDKSKIKNIVLSLESGVSVNAADRPVENNTQFGVLKTSSVSKFLFVPSEHKQVNIEEYGRVSCPVRKNTIIVSRMNTPELVGACGYVVDDYPNLFLPDRLWQITLSESVITKFVWYYLINQKVRSYISSLSSGTSSSMQNISKPQFDNIILLLPNKGEQQEIVNYLDKKCSEIDELIAKKTSLLSELENYKKSLIYEYVTGKKEV